LTGIPNRRYIVDLIDQALNHSNEPFALMMLDLDRFKMINDTYGHEYGDRLLVHVAHVLRATVSPNDTVARLGGDEFLILCPKSDNDGGAVDLAKRILEQFVTSPAIDDIEMPITPSIGIASYPKHGNDRDTLLMRADKAMFAAKELGRNLFAIYSDERK
jgi:diguanylate cyclase (GGDEF)-like protein